MNTIVSNNSESRAADRTKTPRPREVYKIINTRLSHLGELPLNRAFSGEFTNYVSPFYVVDEFGPVTLSPHAPFRVDAHPHAGIIPTTYLLEGDSHHRDSLGNDYQYTKGDFLVFTAGKGALHMEETGGKLFANGGTFHGFQTWLNIPSRLKFSEPYTELFREKEIPLVHGNGYSVKVLLGDAFGTRSNARTLFPVLYLHVTMQAGALLELPVDPAHNAFVYMMQGEIEVADGKAAHRREVVLYHREGDVLRISCSSPAEFLILGGEANNERYVAYGPFVLNNKHEIAKAFEDFGAGRMGDPVRVNGR